MQTANLTDEHIEDAKCADQCPEPCTYRRIEAKISSSLLVPPNQLSGMRSAINQFFTLNREEPTNYTEDQIRQLTSIELYYEMKQMRVVEKTPRSTIDELISNIGGCLGVWSGISFLSIFQIVCYTWRALSHKLAKRKAKRALERYEHSNFEGVKPVYKS
jgi:hypothetical protein